MRPLRTDSVIYECITDGNLHVAMDGKLKGIFADPDTALSYAERITDGEVWAQDSHGCVPMNHPGA